MSGGPACQCAEAKAPLLTRRWVVVMYRYNRSAFNGYRHTLSDYSEVECTRCHRRWRTKALYVAHLKDRGRP